MARRTPGQPTGPDDPDGEEFVVEAIVVGPDGEELVVEEFVVERAADYDDPERVLDMDVRALSAKLDEVHRELREMKQVSQTWLGIEGVTRRLDTGFDEMVGALQPLLSLAPRTLELPDNVTETMARMFDALAVNDWTNAGAFPAPNRFVPFIGSVPTSYLDAGNDPKGARS